MQNQVLQTNTHRYTHTQSHNPLPPPPEPIPTDRVPTLEQAVSGSGSVRFTPLPLSPRSTAGTPYPFEIEKRGHQKGKTRTEERVRYDESLKYTTSTVSSPAPPESSYSSHHRTLTPTTHPSSNYASPRQSTRSNGLQVHFDNTAQPLDAFALTHAYLREYSSGFINGQEAALGRTMTDFPPASPTPVAGQSSSNRHRGQSTSTSAGVVESTQRYTGTSTSIYDYDHHAPYSAPPVHERSPRPSHRRQNTAMSIVSTSTSSIHDDRPSSRSRSSSRTSEAHSAPGSPQYSNPMLASIMSDAQSSRSRQSLDPVSPQPRYAATPNVLSPNIPSHPAQPPPPSVQNRPEASANPNSGTSPSSRSRLSIHSAETWGTPTPSHLADGSLIDGSRCSTDLARWVYFV